MIDFSPVFTTKLPVFANFLLNALFCCGFTEKNRRIGMASTSVDGNPASGNVAGPADFGPLEEPATTWLHFFCSTPCAVFHLRSLEAFLACSSFAIPSKLAMCFFNADSVVRSNSGVKLYSVVRCNVVGPVDHSRLEQTAAISMPLYATQRKPLSYDVAVFKTYYGILLFSRRRRTSLPSNTMQSSSVLSTVAGPVGFVQLEEPAALWWPNFCTTQWNTRPQGGRRPASSDSLDITQQLQLRATFAALFRFNLDSFRNGNIIILFVKCC